MHAHKVRQIEPGLRRADEHGTSLLKACDMLSGEVIVRQQAAAVRIAFQRLVVQGAKQFIHIHFHAEALCKLLKEAYPGIQIGSAVVAVYHGHRAAVRRGHHIKLRMYFFQLMLQHNHRKYGSTCRYISGTGPHTVGRRHSGSRVAFRRAKRRSRFQLSCRIEKLCSFLGKDSRLLSGRLHLRQNLPDLPGISFGSNELLELIQHLIMELSGRGIDREHTGCLPDSHILLSGQFPVNIASQCSHKVNLRHMLFFVQNRLIQVGNAPALRNVELEQFRQLLGRLAGNRISPGAEGHKLVSVFVKYQIAVHHGADSHCPKLCQSHAVFPLYILFQGRVASLKSFPHLIQRIGPDAVLQLVLPVIASGRHRLAASVYQNCLDSRRTKLDAENRFSV